MIHHPAPSTNLAERTRSLRHDNRALREFVLQHLLPMVQQQRPIDEIARAFGITVRQAYKWKNALYQRMGEELRTKTPSDFLAKQITELERTKAYAWQQASIIPSPNMARSVGANGATFLLDAQDVNALSAAKQRWVAIALKADHQLADLYSRAGLLENQPLKRESDTSDEDASDGLIALARIAKAFLTGGYSGAKQLALPAPDHDRDELPVVDDGAFLL
jgi:transposase-like protein